MQGGISGLAGARGLQEAVSEQGGHAGQIVGGPLQ